MICTLCSANTDGQPVVELYISLDDYPTVDRFTGIVWCRACALRDRDANLLADEIAWAESQRAPPRPSSSPASATNPPGAIPSGGSG